MAIAKCQLHFLFFYLLSFFCVCALHAVVFTIVCDMELFIGIVICDECTENEMDDDAIHKKWTHLQI